MERTNDKNRKKPQAPDYEPYPKSEDIYQQSRKKSLDNKEEDWDEDVDYDSYEDPDEEDLEKMDQDDEVDYGDDTDLEEYDEDFPPEFQRMTDTPEDDDWNTENFDTDHTGEDLDVPGSEFDDDQEEIGAEDEENNYYSLGGPDRD